MLRRSFAWLIYSPKRFILASAVVGCVVLGLFLATSTSSPGEPASANPWGEGAQGTRSSDAHPMPSDAHGKPAAEEAAPRDVRQARLALQRFLDAYLRNEGVRDGRSSSALRAVTTPELWRGLRLADPAAFPAGPPGVTHLKLAGAFAEEYQVALPAGEGIRVDLVRTERGWRVCDVQPWGHR